MATPNNMCHEACRVAAMHDERAITPPLVGSNRRLVTVARHRGDRSLGMTGGDRSLGMGARLNMANGLCGELERRFRSVGLVRRGDDGSDVAQPAIAAVEQGSRAERGVDLLDGIGAVLQSLVGQRAPVRIHRGFDLGPRIGAGDKVLRRNGDLVFVHSLAVISDRLADQPFST